MLHAACDDAGIGSGVVEFDELSMWARRVHSRGSAKVAGHVFFVSLRIHAGGSGMRQIRGHSMWEGGMPRMAK